MAKIPLRTYNNEIETIIEQQQTEEAIAHCKHILKIYPKHVDTYRLLGKAYLESHRLGNAADIFERVLSAIPYDFVSHVGLSITSEDIGDLDKAIWHMERAFEGQPYNAAIQGELRRLYGKRDGMDPPKIHLTRAALARMYAKGDLFQQAIAELRAAIAEDPNRIDLRIFLAKMYVQVGETTKAIDSCGSILKKLPYCQDANQMLVQLLTESGRADESDIYRKRLQELDPYQAHVNLNDLDKDRVKDQAVLVEQLIWDGGPAIMPANQPDWATSVGVKIDDSEEVKDDFQDWLENSSEGHENFSENVENVGDNLDDDLIPDFMKDAGWGPSTGSFDEGKLVVDNNLDENENVDEAVEGELPDWLQNLAPSDDNITTNGELVDKGELSDSFKLNGIDDADLALEIFGGEQAPQQIPDWLSEIAGETESVSESEGFPSWIGADEDTSSAVPTDSEEAGLPDWLVPTALGAAGVIGAAAADNVENEKTEEAVEQSKEVDEIIIQDAFVEESKAETETQTHPIVGDETDQVVVSLTDDVESSDLPDWLNDVDIEKDSTQTEISQLPDWLQDIDEKPESPILMDEAKSEHIPEWLADFIDEESKPEEVEEAISEEESQSDWILDTLVEQEEPETQTLDGDSYDDLITAPEEEFGLSYQNLEISSESELLKDAEEEILAGTRETNADEDIPSEAEPGFSEDTESMFTEELGMEDFDLVEEDTIAVDESEMSGWVQEVVEIEEDLEEGIEQEPQLQIEDEFPQSDEFNDTDSAFAWLENLATNHDVLESELRTIPDQQSIARTETGTDRIQEIQDVEPLEDDTAFQDTSSEDYSEIPVPTDAVESLAEGEQQIWLEEDRIETDAIPESDDESVLEPVEISESLDDVGGDSHMFPEDDIELEIPFEDEVDETPDESEVILESTSTDIDDSEISFTWLEDLEPKSEIIEEEIQISSQIESNDSQVEIIPDSPELFDFPQDSTSVRLNELDAQSKDISSSEKLIDEPDFDDADAALAWLESLAAKHGVSEDELLTNPDDRSETPPDWVQEETLSEVLIDSEIDSSITLAQEESSDLEFEDTQKTDDDDSPIFVESSEVESAIEPGEKLEDIDAAMAWLESLAAKQGVSEDELLTSPGDRSETPPDWVLQSEESDKTLASIISDQDQMDGTFTPQEGEIPYAPPAWISDGQVPKDEDLSWLPTEEIEDEKQLLDLNQASLIQLERIPGIGFRKAQNITAYREEHGGFKNLDSLMNVPGMDHETLELLKTRVTINIPEVGALEEDAGQQEDLYDLLHAKPGDEIHEQQIAAQAKLNTGNIIDALDDYKELIQNGQRQNAVIDDLVMASEKYPHEVSIWQTLGDAYMNANRLQDAIEAYTKAQNLLD